MAQKHLKELLKEDQEPFLLKDYISNRQCEIKKQTQKTQIQLKKPKPTSKNTPFLCKNACFFSLQNSPDPHKSPLFDFTKSPCKSPNRVFLHVPAKTASLLLEAAMRIQKQTKPKTHIKNSGFGLFGSMLKRLTLRNKGNNKLKGNETGDLKTGENRGFENNVVVFQEKKVVNVESCVSTSTSTSSLSSSCSCSGRSFNGDDDGDDNEGFEFVNVLKENDEDYGVCLSPFRFALYSTPSPDLRSPAKSPLHPTIQGKMKYEEEETREFNVDEDEEDKEQNSPVSVLDPPFDDDYDGQEEGIGYDLDCSYAFVQKAKHHLLHKLQRFEKLAELDPIELEKRMLEEDDDDEELELGHGDYDKYDYESFMFDEQRQVDELIDDIIRTSGFQDIKKLGIKRLVSELIIEEENSENAGNCDVQLIKRVCKRLESWKGVEANTIDMMVEMDLRRENGDWKKPREQIVEAATDVEVAIFAVLVDELVDDLFFST